MKKTDLSKLVPGDRARITAVGSIGAVKRRLMDMGLLPGAEVLVQKVAPLGDPIEVRVRSYSLSLRKSEAEGVAVEVTP
jgi:ferrous iron transport protein A